MKYFLPLVFSSFLPVSSAMQQGAGLAEFGTDAREAAPVSLAFGDFNADGRKDVYALNPRGVDRLYRNDGDGRLVDVTSQSGLAGAEGTRRAVFIDWDLDGLEDLLTLGAQGTRLYKNIGASFVDVTALSGVSHEGVDVDAAWIDFDEDGLPDLYVEQSTRVLLYRGAGGDVFELVELPSSDPLSFGSVSAGGSEDFSVGGAAAGAGVRRAAPGRPTNPPRPALGPKPITPSLGLPGMGTGSLGGGQMDAIVGGGCSSRIADAANGANCLLASSDPTLGMLFPMSEELFVDGTNGRVGVGTTAPAASFHVVGEDLLLGTLLVAPATTTSEGISELWLAEDHDGDFRMGLRYDGTENVLQLLSSVDGAEAGPWLSVKRLDGAMGVAGDMSVAGRFSADDTDINSITVPDGILNTTGRVIIRAEPTGGGVFTPAAWIENDDDSSGAGTAMVVVSDGDIDLSPVAYFIQNGSGPILTASAGSGEVWKVTNTGRTVTSAVEITGGGDLVEGFDSREGVLEAGTVVIIDSDNPGQLKTSSSAYDRKVAGVISGAGGVNHGIRMGQHGVMDGENLVAMTGRVYVKCTTENGPIEAGDLLTTSSRLGHAMRGSDIERSFGAVIGKAMTTLAEGEGLVLVLVNLQ